LDRKKRRGLDEFKDIIGRLVRKNVDGDIFTKHYFHRAHREERKELETGMIL
jgi:hypothetical protein